MPRRGENIYLRKDGRYEGRYARGRSTDGKTRYGYVYGKYYKDVKKEIAKMRANVTDFGRIDRAACPNLSEWTQKWMRTRVLPFLKPTTANEYEGILRRHILPELGACSLSAIDAERLRAFRARLEKGGLAASTAQGVMRLLRAALRAAVSDHLIGSDPFADVRGRRAPAQSARVLTRTEQREIEIAAAKAGYLEILVSLYTGARLGEVCALTRNDVNLRSGVVSIRQTVSRIEKPTGVCKTELFLGTPKTQTSARQVQIPSFLNALLRERIDETGEGYLFGRRDKPADPRTVQKRLSSVCAKLGIEGVHFHTLRHTYATRCLEMNVDVKTLSVLLGHSSARITMDIYAHSTLDSQREAARRLEAMHGELAP